MATLIFMAACVAFMIGFFLWTDRKDKKEGLAE
jgi:hypothetical protein